ncbi:DoxX family protein [Jiulongibacter sp. NS-SX5]|uniref:DoxX family protein n=1 Tax=Jiulongibacter sp. NS-SX5 TaxID=3463854 RepID=UPI004059EE63
MKPLYVLLVVFILALIGLKIYSKDYQFQLAGRIALAVMLVFTSIGHFAFAEGMTAMIPEPIPFKSQLVFLTGLLEIAFAIGILVPKYQYLVGILLIVFLILILPANIYAALNKVNYQTGTKDGPGLEYLWIRVPLQLLFIIWTYFAVLFQQKS